MKGVFIHKSIAPFHTGGLKWSCLKHLFHSLNTSSAYIHVRISELAYFYVKVHASPMTMSLQPLFSVFFISSI